MRLQTAPLLALATVFLSVTAAPLNPPFDQLQKRVALGKDGVTSLLPSATAIAIQKVEKRQAILNSCDSLFRACISSITDSSAYLSAPFGYNNICTLAALCNIDSVDGYLLAVYRTFSPRAGAEPLPPNGQSVARLSQDQFTALAGGAALSTQQTFINVFLSTVQSINAPTPTDAQVAAIWERIAAWTGFCAGDRGIQYNNLADYFTYSSAVPGPRTCDPIPGANGSCDALANACIAARAVSSSPEFSNPFSSAPCVLGASCFSTGIDFFLIRVLGQGNRFPSATPYGYSLSATSPRLSQAVFNTFSTNQQTWTQQNFIDAYYQTLASTNPPGPYPDSADYPIAQWAKISAWTGFCTTREIPYNNLADYYQFAATVPGSTLQC